MTIALIAHDAKKRTNDSVFVSHTAAFYLAISSVRPVQPENWSVKQPVWKSSVISAADRAAISRLQLALPAMKLTYCCSSGIRSTARNRNRTKWHCSASAMSTMFRLQPILQQQKR